MAQHSNYQSHTAKAGQKHELLTVLGETEYASAALDQQKRYIADLENEIGKIDQHIQDIHAQSPTTAAPPPQEIQYDKGSAIGRFARRLSGRKNGSQDTAASAHSHADSDSTAHLRQAESARNSVTSILEEAKKRRSNLEDTVKRHQHTQKELDDLYGSAFDDPSIQRASSQYYDVAAAAGLEVQTQQILEQAKAKLHAGRFGMESAREHQDSNWSAVGSHAFSMERTSVSNAQKSVLDAGLLIAQAQRINPKVKPIVDLQTGQDTGMSPYLYEVLNALGFKDKLRSLLDRVLQSIDAVEKEEERSRQRLEEIQQQAKERGERLNSARSALQKARE